jgi:23S rRNA (uracil1939-C5)-methyltransferase
MKRSTNDRTAWPRVSLSLRIEDLAPGGAGVGHALLDGDRRAVFVPRAAVGDLVEVDVDTSTRPARGRVLRLLSPGEGRVAPPCAYVDACGACDWMHLSRSAQREARESHLRRALPAPWRELPITLHDTIDSLGHRTRARLHVRASGGRAVVGMHGAGTREIVDVDACVVLHPALDGAIVPLAAILEGAHGRGEAQIALGLGGKPVLDLRWDGRLPPAVFGRLEQAVLAGTWAGASLSHGDVSRPAVVGDPTPRMTGADGEPAIVAVGGFAQASDTGNVLLARRVLALAEEALPAGSRTGGVVELYAGAGNFTVLLARAFERVVAIESDAAGCEAARANLAARGLRARVTCADADAFDVPPRTDLVVLDPPRRGARTPCAALAARGVKAIVYVSCDPPTLGRDLAVLAARYEPFAIESFAMFPGTSHAESVVALRRRRDAARP